MENEKQNNQLQIELKDDVAKGCYANLAIINHSQSEFIVDFASLLHRPHSTGEYNRR